MNPEYLAKLREEALEARKSPPNVLIHDIPYIDSFIKEQLDFPPA